jgi:hypothetical protein
LLLRNTTPEHLCKIIKKFEPKQSCDIHGVSTKMIKFIGHEISTPLAHIFNLSLTSGNFPSQLKLLLLLLLNRLPPDITGGQGLNGFSKIIFFFTILQKKI